MNKLYLDVESTGLKGKLNLIQYKYKEEDIVLFRPFQHQEQSLRVSELLSSSETLVIGYNIGFDLWKLYQHYKPSKPFNCSCLDLYLHILRGKPLNKFPSKGKSIIQVKKVSNVCKDKLDILIQKKLREHLPKLFDIKLKESKEGEELTTLSYKISFNLKLKNLMAKLFDEKTLDYEDCMKLVEDENTRIPFVLQEEKEKYENVWQENEKILDDPNSNIWQYAKSDIEYLITLENFLIEQGNETENNTLKLDENDTVTHIVSYTKYEGFTVDVEKIEDKKDKIETEIKNIDKFCKSININPMSHKQKKELYMKHALNKEIIPASFDKKHIRIAIKEKFLSAEGIRIFEKLQNYQSLNQRLKQLEAFQKSAEETGKVFPDFRIFGTATNRLAGTGGINFQGIARDGDIRELVLCSQGGDFDSLEIGIAASYFQDKQMLADLDNGVDLHTQTACLLKLIDLDYKTAQLLKNLNINELESSELTEEQEKKAKKTLRRLQKIFKNARGKAKMINFAILYFATSHKISSLLNIEPEDAEKLMEEKFFSHYPQLQKNREKFHKNIVTADTTTWSRNSISSMITIVEDAVGNVRNFSLEKEVAKYFWENSNKIASEVSVDFPNVYIIRQETKGKQLIKNAILSALLGAVIGIQNTLYRQAGNFPIQTTGATLTKKLMVEIWNVHHVPMMNVHDEIMIPAGYEKSYKDINQTVQNFVLKNRQIVKHLSMSWTKIKNWSEK